MAFKEDFLQSSGHNLNELEVNLFSKHQQFLEYDLGGAEHGDREISMEKNQVFDFMKVDLNYLRQTWQQAD